MLGQSAKELFDHWIQEGKAENGWSDGKKFFYFYLCLNVLMANLSRENSDIKMLNWVKKNESMLSRSYSEKIAQQPFFEMVQTLQRLSPVADARPNSHKEVAIKDPTNMGQVLEVIYQVRCNFFHGNKMLSIDRNRRLVEVSTRILSSWMQDL